MRRRQFRPTPSAAQVTIDPGTSSRDLMRWGRVGIGRVLRRNAARCISGRSGRERSDCPVIPGKVNGLTRLPVEREPRGDRG